MANDSTSPQRELEASPANLGEGEAELSRRDVLRAGTAGAVGAALGVSGFAGSAAADDTATPRLQRDGNLIVDPDGNTVTLRGVNIADPKRINLTAPARGMDALQVIDFLTDHSNDWYPRAIRVPVQPVDIGEYEPGSGPPVPAFGQSELESYLSNHLDDVVQRCAERGVYCIVDYHRHRDVMWAEGQDGPINQELHDEVDMFWDVVAPRYADQSHVLYEVYNEPTEPGMWEDPTTTDWVADVWQLWLEMAQPWVDTIRSHADNMILMGSPSWSQSPEGALVEEFDGSDIAYTFHIYPGHNSSQNNDWEDASNNGEGVAGVYEQAPLVVTEFGWEENAGQYIGGTTSGYGDPILDWMESSDAISWTAWCADPVWRPVMFERGFVGENATDSIGDPYNETIPEVCSDQPCEWDLLGGDAYMGETVKNALFDLRNDNVPGSDGTGGDPDTTPPSAPSNLTVTDTSASSVSVSWDASSDDDTGVDQYAVTVDGSLDQEVGAGTTSATIDGLSADTTYEIGVSAEDGAGNTSAATNVTASTDEDTGDPGDGDGDPGDGDGDPGDGSGDLIAGIDPGTTSASTGDLVQFWITDETGSGNWITDLQWDLGNGTTDSGWYAGIRYQSAGTYTVSLTATDNEGTTTTDEVTVEIS